jgi:hypothetical protein
MAHENINTVPQLKQAVKLAKRVFVQPKFGVSENWVQISKREANDFVSKMEDDTTPHRFEMYADTFGTFYNRTLLYLG